MRCARGSEDNASLSSHYVLGQKEEYVVNRPTDYLAHPISAAWLDRNPMGATEGVRSKVAQQVIGGSECV